MIHVSDVTTLGFGFIHFTSVHNNGYKDGRSQIQVHTDEQT